MMNAKETLSGWLAAGDPERVIAGLRVVNKKMQIKEIALDVDLQSGRYQNLKKNYLNGVVSYADYSIELSKINQSLQTNINFLPEDWIVEELNEVAPSSGRILSRSKLGWKRWEIVLGLLALLAAVAGYTLKDFFTGKNSDSMQLTVYVQNPDGTPVAELQNKGQIIVDFGNDRRAPLIGEHGRTNLGEIPEKFRGEKILIALKAEGYKPTEPAKQYVLDGEPVYFGVRRDNSLGLIQGIVKDRSGEKFLAGTMVMIDNDTITYTDNLGRFHLLLPPSKRRDTYYLTIKKEGFKVKNEYLMPNTGSIEIRLDK